MIILNHTLDIVSYGFLLHSVETIRLCTHIEDYVGLLDAKLVEMVITLSVNLLYDLMRCVEGLSTDH
jgi:hypothetical protein